MPLKRWRWSKGCVSKSVMSMVDAKEEERTRDKRPDLFLSWASVPMKMDIHFAKVSNNFEGKIYSFAYRHMSVSIFWHIIFFDHRLISIWRRWNWILRVQCIHCIALIIVTVDCCRNVHLSFSCIISFIPGFFSLFILNAGKYAVSYLNWFSLNDPRFSLTVCMDL